MKAGIVGIVGLLAAFTLAALVTPALGWVILAVIFLGIPAWLVFDNGYAIIPRYKLAELREKARENEEPTL